jgi:ABC-type transport system substrate-binding protein
MFLRTCFDSLLFYDNDGKLTADLATKWESDSTAKTLTFHLRTGVKFSDGTDFNAEAVKWNIEQYQAAKRTETANIASIETPDANTVVMHLTNWDSSALTSIGYFIYYMSPTAIKAHDATWAESNPVGTGPFTMTEWKKGVSVKYVKNKNYWQEGKPYLDGINFTIISDVMTLESSLKNGEIDMISYADFSTMKDLEGDNQYKRETNSNGVGVEGFGLIPNSANSSNPFSNVKVRQAFCYAIDSETIIKTAGLGYMQTTNQWAAPGAATYNKDVQAYPYSPDKAKKLLADAGYANGFDTTLYSVNSGIYQDVCTAAAQQLNAVGIRAKIETTDATKFNSQMANGCDGIMLHFNSISPDLGLYMGRHLDTNGAFYAKMIQHPQDALDLLGKIRTAPDDTTKTQYSMKLQKMIYDDYALFGKPMAVQSINTIKCSYVSDDNFLKANAAAWTPWTTWINK